MDKKLIETFQTKIKSKSPRSGEINIAYRNKTYVAFDGDNDMSAYRYM